MVKLRRILQDLHESGAFNALVNIHAIVDDHTFLTKGGQLVTFLQVKGVDHECLDHSQVEQVTQRTESALRMLDESCRLYQYLIKRRHGPIPSRTYETPVVGEAIGSRAAYLDGKQLYSVAIYWVVSYEAWRPSLGMHGNVAAHVAAGRLAWLQTLFSTEKLITGLEGTFDQAREALANKVNRLAAEMGDVANLEVLDKQRAFRFLYGLINYAPHKVAVGHLRDDRFVDFQLCDSELECHREHLRLDDHYLQVLTLKEPPAQTRANLLKGFLEIPAEFIIATEWQRVGNATLRKLVRSKQRHFHNAKTSLLSHLSSSEKAPQDLLVDQSAAAIVADLGNCLEEMELHGRYFGQFSLSIVLFDEDRSRLRRSVAESFKACAAVDIALTEERYNLLNAFLAVLPGNDIFNVRRVWLHNANYADLSLLFAPHVGEAENPTLRTEYLAVLETNHRTPYFFNLHVGDVAHALVIGATGSGKSFSLNFFLTHAQKYSPYTFIFDLGGSYESLTRRFGGTYAPIGRETRSFSINLFTLPPTAENLRFLLTFLRVLIESDGYSMSARDEQDVYDQIESVYAVEPSQRRLLTLANILNRNLRERLARWVEGGPYSFLFDNVEDNLSFARFQTFDFEGMDKTPQLLEPLLFYILHRANAAIHDPALLATWKIFLVEEAWRFLRHPAIRQYVQEGFKTWRKRNAAMLLVTQSSDDLLHSEMLQIVVESCATKLFLANPGMSIRAYREAFQLNETEASLVAGLVPKRQILIKRPDRSKIVNLNVESREYSLYTNNFHNNGIGEALRHCEQPLDLLTRSQP